MKKRKGGGGYIDNVYYNLSLSVLFIIKIQYEKLNV